RSLVIGDQRAQRGSVTGLEPQRPVEPEEAALILSDPEEQLASLPGQLRIVRVGRQLRAQQAPQPRLGRIDLLPPRPLLHCFFLPVRSRLEAAIQRVVRFGAEGLFRYRLVEPPLGAPAPPCAQFPAPP